ncbi:MAG: hypothetical protein U5K00_04225 [Melioribacteraceae bacterium]|nr:hypothetical protein [Melioribacteraceae bacterium]
MPGATELRSQIIGTDGGLLENPVQKDYLTFGPAERFDIIVDLSE